MASSQGVVPGLDGLRAVSILLVLGQYFLTAATPGGYGVFVFFVISGFLITRLLLAERKSTSQISLTKFYARRVIRLYPLVVLYTAIVCCLYWVSGREIQWLDPAASLFYFCNYLVSDASVKGAHLAMQEFTHFWSLSVEEQFYIGMPCVLLLTRTPQGLAIAAATICAAAAALRLGFATAVPEYIGTHFFYTRTEFRVDSLGYGVLLAALCECRPALVSRLSHPMVCVALALLTLITIVLLPRLPVLVLRDSVMGLFVMASIAGVVFNPTFWPASLVLNSAPLVWIGRLSYSLYVWHYGVVVWLQPHMHGLAFKVVGFLLTVAVATLSYYWIEKPLLHFRTRLRVAVTY